MTTEAAFKAIDTRLYQWGPNELTRAAAMAEWTKNNPEQLRLSNPHTRARTYSHADHLRAKNFVVWAKAHPGWAHVDNPFVHPHYRRAEAGRSRPC